jgi:hypothetical protein
MALSNRIIRQTPFDDVHQTTPAKNPEKTLEMKNGFPASRSGIS